jgi:hypothetical protein
MRWSALALLLLLWATRLGALERLPLHNDEGLHLTRAVEVWNGHPFWAISDGKIINHWLIAAFYPQNAPVFIGRFATILVAMLGLAAGWALARRLGGSAAALLAGALWIGSPYLFFYERLAFSDPEAGALVVLALLLSLRLARSGRARDAIFTGAAFGAAALFKFTAAPFALGIVLVVLFIGSIPLPRKIINLMMVGMTVAACFAVPLVYLMLRGDDFFSIALGWIGASGGKSPALVSNLERLWLQLTGFGSITWAMFTLAGLILLAFSPRPRRGLIAFSARKNRILLLAGLLPFLLMLIVGKEVLSRHYVVALPILFTLAGLGLALLVEQVKRSARGPVVGLGVSALGIGFLPFLTTAYQNPALLPLPEDARYEHITSPSSGFGLREAVGAFPQTITRRGVPIIGSMFPDSCKRANFYAVDGLKMRCVDAPGLPQIESALTSSGAVYILADDAPRIGIDVTTLPGKATRIAAYPRPGEDADHASVVLWLVEK